MKDMRKQLDDTTVCLNKRMDDMQMNLRKELSEDWSKHAIELEKQGHAKLFRAFCMFFIGGILASQPAIKSGDCKIWTQNLTSLRPFDQLPTTQPAQHNLNRPTSGIIERLIRAAQEPGNISSNLVTGTFANIKP
ncbi:hypothetical protein LSTR_LSTR007599 [Laodelphax striatellus]|uniref:Uncharacterized protein n=1 Tax=Laodelphax striatellus TaxID=195883 RepID=A0A482XKZ1_LAOST|nr:hypothetical protein LSTR_LSTR007599 [Laodelphax striatellus]